MLRVNVGNKYTLIQDTDGRLRALRYGEEWRDLVGSGLVLMMAQRIETLENALKDILSVNVTSQEDCHAAQVIAQKGLRNHD